MVNILNYFNLSEPSERITNIYATPDDFKDFYHAISENEKRSVIRHFIINNVPYAFKEKPILYEQLVQYLADKLQISTNDIKLIGSAKTGFSVSPLPDYGRRFGQHSDLDFSIINEDIFFSLEREFNNWADQYNNKTIFPNNARQESFWNSNLYEVPRYQLKNEFIDTYRIPNWSQFSMAKNINNSLALIAINLKNIHSLEIKQASVRVYKSWGSFSRKVNQNIDIVMKKTS